LCTSSYFLIFSFLPTLSFIFFTATTGFPAAFLSAALDQSDRLSVMRRLRDFALRVVVSTDLVARGVDLDRANFVVSLDLPYDAATYMHRVGRTGRFGTRGVAVAILAGKKEAGKLQEYLREFGGGQAAPLPSVIPEDLYAFEVRVFLFVFYSLPSIRCSC
jgi:superfamily II DNA/RNA helicase